MNAPIKVLFIDNSTEDVDATIRTLSLAGFTVSHERVETADMLRAALHRRGWDVIISEQSLVRLSGREALGITLQLAPDVPFVLVSGTASDEESVDTIRAGAADYVMKSNLIRLVPTVTRVVWDANERRAMRRAEADLRAQRSLLGLIYDNTSDGILFYTWSPSRPEWHLVTVNRAATRQFAMVSTPAKIEELVGATVEEVNAKLTRFVMSDAEENLSMFYRASEQGRSVSREVEVQTTTGTRYAEIQFVPFYAPNGVERHVLVAIRDITVRKMAEADRREFEARLAQSKKMEALGKLAGGVAHDFNNILAGILGYAEFLQKTNRDASVVTYTGEIVQAAKRARDLVRQILMFSRREVGERRPVRLSVVANEAVQLVSSTTPSNICIEKKFAADELHVMGDYSQLHQVVLNLVTNAIQAIGDVGGRIDVVVDTVSVSAEMSRQLVPLREGEHVRLIVADDGPGIPHAHLDRLFEPFFTTKAPGVGTGLGLAVVHGVLQGHDGAIKITTAEGQGTRFELYFPAVRGPSWNGDSLVPEVASPPKGLRILFVDDEPSITRLAQVMLRSMGHFPTICGDPATAIAKLNATPNDFDLIITDLTMPGLTGLDVAGAARTHRKDLPIVLSSGYSHEVPEETLLNLGIFVTLPKPFQMAGLVNAITRATKKDE